MKFIDKELSIKLKEKGFDKPCFGWYDNKIIDNNKLYLNVKEGSYKDLLEYTNDFEWIIDAPTIDQVLEWLREEKNIHINVNALPSICTNYISTQGHRLLFDIRVSYFKEDMFNYYDLDEPYFKYEDACIAGIEYVVEHLI
jgi:hypothetical protein